jgi:hypothetical protein
VAGAVIFRVEQDADQKYFEREATVKKHTPARRCDFHYKNIFPRKVKK